MKRSLHIAIWVAISLLGAVALSTIALNRGEPLNATWFVLAAACCFLVAFRFYSAFLTARVFALDNTRATPAERRDDGRDFVPTNKWVLLGHHFAAIAGPGPLVGPTLAAQFGYLPGTLWLIAGAVLGGCVQDFVILFCSMRRDGKSLGQMAREEVSRRGGFLAQLAVLAIMVILLAVVGLVVVNALKDSPWATFTLAMTVPIALLMGVYLRYWRPGRVLEASLLGIVMIVFVVVAGQWVAAAPSWTRVFTLSGPALAISIIVDAFRGRQRPCLCREDFPVLLHHHRLRSRQRLPFAHFVRDDAEDDSSRRPRANDRLRRDADGVIRRCDGYGGGVRDGAGRLFRN